MILDDMHIGSLGLMREWMRIDDRGGVYIRAGVPLLPPQRHPPHHFPR